MTSPVIIQFKRYPELGRLKVVADTEIHSSCSRCALEGVNCEDVEDDEKHKITCYVSGYRYEQIKDE